MDNDEEIKERLKKEWGVNSNSQSFWNFEKTPLKEVYTIDSVTVSLLKEWEYIYGLATAAMYVLVSQENPTLKEFGHYLWEELDATYAEVKELTKSK